MRIVVSFVEFFLISGVSVVVGSVLVVFMMIGRRLVTVIREL